MSRLTAGFFLLYIYANFGSMKTHVIYLSIIAAILFYSFIPKTGEEKKDDKWKVTGIGGIFFKCKSTATLKKWYADNLGFKTNQYGTMFEFRRSDPPSYKGYLQWSPFNEKTKYFLPSQKEFMINYRVENLEAMVEDLKAKNVTILDTIASYDYGKFVHILDCDSNKIELWEPVDGPFTKEYEGETMK